MKSAEDIKSILFVAIGDKREDYLNIALPLVNLRQPLKGDDFALHSAVKLKTTKEIFQILIKAGAPLEAQDEQGLTPLDCAFLLGDADRAKILIEVGADYNRALPNGKPYLKHFELKHPDKFPDVMESINRRLGREEMPQENQFLGFMFNLMKSVGLNVGGSGYRKLPADDQPLKLQDKKNR